MFVSSEMWRKIRDQFADSERATLRSAVTSQVFCPRGFRIDVERLDAGLADKFTGLIDATMRARTGAPL